MAYRVRFVEPAKVYRMIKDELDAAYLEVMEKGDLIDRGQLKSFEENLAKFVGTKYAVGLNSGYDALHISLRAAGIGLGDEVIVPAHTFVATASAVVNVGAKPILVDVGKDFNIDVNKIENVLTSKTRAIIPVHLSGYMADMVSIREIAEKYNLVIVEDACQSLGASMENRAGGTEQDRRCRVQGAGCRVQVEEAGNRKSEIAERPEIVNRKSKIGDGTGHEAWGIEHGAWGIETRNRESEIVNGIEHESVGRGQKAQSVEQDKGKTPRIKAGAWGLTGCWSFYPFKILGGYGDGGAITTNDPGVALFATRMRFNGEDRDTGEYHGHGFTCLLDNMQAAFLDVKLKYLPQWIGRRKAIAEKYRNAFEDIPDLLLPHYDDSRRDHVYQNYTVCAKQGNEFSEYLKKNGVEVLTQFRKPYYKHEALGLENRGFPETEALSIEVCSLPMNVEITDEEIDYVISVVRSFYRK